MIFATGTLIALVVSILWAISCFFIEKTTGLVKRPPGYAIIGHPQYFNFKTLLQTMAIFCKKYGPVYELFIFQARFLIINDVQSIKEITMKRPKYFRRDAAIEGPFRSLDLFPSSLFIAEGQVWSRLRRLLSTPFNRTNADAMASSLFAEVIDLIRRLKETRGKSVNVNSEMMQYTLRVIIRVALGNFTLDEYLTTGQIVIDTNTLFDYLVQRSFYSEFIWSFLAPFSSLQKKAFAANNRIENLVSSVLENSEAKRSSSKTFIDILISESQAATDDGHSKLSKHEVIANIKTMMLAGSETTSVVLSWCLFYLSQYPEHLQRLRREAEEKLPNLEKFCPENFTRCELPYASACFRESLRLKGPAPILGSCLVNKDGPYILSSGVEIRPHDSVFLYLEGVHTDETIFVNPMEFNPSRWLDNDEKTLEKMSSHFFAFGYGSRICPGMYLAQHEGEIALSYMAQYFDFELGCRPEEVIRIQSFTARPEYLPIKFKLR